MFGTSERHLCRQSHPGRNRGGAVNTRNSRVRTAPTKPSNCRRRWSFSTFAMKTKMVSEEMRTLPFARATEGLMTTIVCRRWHCRMSSNLFGSGGSRDRGRRGMHIRGDGASAGRHDRRGDHVRNLQAGQAGRNRRRRATRSSSSRAAGAAAGAVGRRPVPVRGQHAGQSARDLPASAGQRPAPRRLGRRSASSRSRSRRARDDEVWVVNHLSDSVSIVDVDDRRSAARRRARCSSATSRATSCSPAPSASARSSPPRTAARTPADDPQICTTAGVGRADVWVFDAEQPRRRRRRHAA